MKSIQRLVRHECCNHNSNGCIMRQDCADKGCLLFSDDPKTRCPFFERSVLPMNANLEAEYNASRSIPMDSEQPKRKRAPSKQAPFEAINGGGVRERN